MITTVTTVTTVTAIATLGFTTAIGIAAAVGLIIFLATRELASAGNTGFSLKLARFIGVGILPLAIAFAAVVAVKIAEIL